MTCVSFYFFSLSRNNNDRDLLNPHPAPRPRIFFFFHFTKTSSTSRTSSLHDVKWSSWSHWRQLHWISWSEFRETLQTSWSFTRKIMNFTSPLNEVKVLKRSLSFYWGEPSKKQNLIPPGSPSRKSAPDISRFHPVLGWATILHLLACRAAESIAFSVPDRNVSWIRADENYRLGRCLGTCHNSVKRTTDLIIFWRNWHLCFCV